MYAGQLRHRVVIYKRQGETASDLGAFIAGAARRAAVNAAAPREDEYGDAVTGVGSYQVVVRRCPETKTWDASMRLLEVAGPGGLGRWFDIIGPAQPDETGRWLIFHCETGKISGDIE